MQILSDPSSRPAVRAQSAGPMVLLCAFLCICSLFTAAAATSVTQYGITWKFSEDRPVGQFVNGDYWVLGPVTITNISRPSGNRDRDGSMVNPMPGAAHGYDSRVGGYSTNLNVALKLPLQVLPDSSVVSSISSSLARPVLEVAAILTVVGTPPAAGSFRPAYAGTSKTVYNANALRTELLLSLKPVPNTPALSVFAGQLQKPWIDHVMDVPGDYLHPRSNMPNYGAAMARDAHSAALRLLLNDTVELKRPLLVNFVQLGIDNYALVKNGADWGTVGGSIGVGRKLPIIAAGLFLGESNLLNVASQVNTRAVFQEDGQTFFLTQKERDGTYHEVNCSKDEAYCWPGYYDKIPIGTPAWGERHYRWQGGGYNYLPGKPAYLDSTFNSTLGAALFVKLMKLRQYWAHDAFLEWSAHTQTFLTAGSYKSAFTANMYAAYGRSVPPTRPVVDGFK